MPAPPLVRASAECVPATERRLVPAQQRAVSPQPAWLLQVVVLKVLLLIVRLHLLLLPPPLLVHRPSWERRTGHVLPSQLRERLLLKATKYYI